MTRFRIAVFNADEAARTTLASRILLLASGERGLDIDSFAQLPALKKRMEEVTYDLICADLSASGIDDLSGLWLLPAAIREGQGPLIYIDRKPRTPFRGIVKAAGAFEYIEKDAPDEELLSIVDQALQLAGPALKTIDERGI